MSTRTELGTFLTITQGMTGSLCPVQPVRKSCAGKHAVPLKIHRPWAKHCGEKNSKERFSEKYPLFVGIPSPAPQRLACLPLPPSFSACPPPLPPPERVCLKPFCVFVLSSLSLLRFLLYYFLTGRITQELFVSGGKLRWRILIWGFFVSRCQWLPSAHRPAELQVSFVAQ